MKRFRCNCGQMLFFDNNRCLACGHRVAFDPATFTMGALSANGTANDASLCRNGAEHGVCNWLVHEAEAAWCLSCRLNQTIPDLSASHRLLWWKHLEQAKRRLIYSLLALNLPISGKDSETDGLAFDFIEDKRTNPDVFEDHVYTGHAAGLITINVAEADTVSREISRQHTGELYRTLLGHFRHESGHYYFSRLVREGAALQEFRELFGDERADYAQALANYYADRDFTAQHPDYISRYAQAHPLEDWAEIWSHYLHMVDTLETAVEYNVQERSAGAHRIDDMVLRWSELSIRLNELNRSMGMEDAYPFVLADATFRKLRFVHGLIHPIASTTTGAASA